MPKVSVIVPVYKAEDNLERCVDSILAQSITDIEVILVDDGSPDRSGKICDDYAKKDDRINVIHQTNKGVAAARNAGINIATGQYLMFCDSDDFVDRYWCEYLTSYSQDQASMAICHFYGIPYIQDVKIENKEFSKNNIFFADKNEFWTICQEYGLESIFNKAFVTKFVKDRNILFDERKAYGEDALFIMDYLSRIDNGKFVLVNAYLYYYIQARPGSLTNQYIPNIWKNKLALFAKLDSLLEKYGIKKEDIEKEYYTKWIQAITWAIASETASDNPAPLNKKLKQLKDILCAQESKIAFQKGSFNGISNIYSKVLKTRQPAVVYTYIMMSRWKGKTRHG